MTTPAHLGLWVDDTPQAVATPEFFDSVVGLGVGAVALMVDRPVPKWSPLWLSGHVADACELAIERDLEVVLTSWPYPSRRALDEMTRGMRELLAFGASAWEIDIEGLWAPRHVDGFRDLEEASEYLVDCLRDVCNPRDCRVDMTTHALHRENGERAIVAPHVDRLVVQAYSVSERDGRPVPWTSGYGPRGMQRFALERAKGTPGNARLCAGLAAWSQDWPGHTPREAMDLAYSTAVDYGPFEVRWWSSKHVIGRLRNSYAAEAIRRLGGRPC